MASAIDRVVDELCKLLMDTPPLLGQRALVERRREQRVAETSDALRDFDRAGRDRRVEQFWSDSRGPEERGRRSAVRSHDKECLTRRAIELLDMRGHEPVERLRNGKRLRRIDGAFSSESTGKLERVERVAARRLDQAEHHAARERPVQPPFQE